MYWWQELFWFYRYAARLQCGTVLLFKTLNGSVFFILFYHKNVLSKASTFVADGIHHVHLDIGGKSCGFGGNRRQDMKLWSLLTRCLNRLASTLKHKNSKLKILYYEGVAFIFSSRFLLFRTDKIPWLFQYLFPFFQYFFKYFVFQTVNLIYSSK